MADSLASRVLDLGLNVLDTEADKLFICSAEPTTYTEASSTYALGNHTASAGALFGSPANATPNGRKVSYVGTTTGSVTATGTATKWGVVDSANSRLLANGSLSASQAVTNGNTFGLAAFDVRIPAS